MQATWASFRHYQGIIRSQFDGGLPERRACEGDLGNYDLRITEEPDTYRVELMLMAWCREAEIASLKDAGIDMAIMGGGGGVFVVDKATRRVIAFQPNE